MRFSQKVGLTLGTSLLILTILLIIVAGRTYKTEAVVGRVVNINSDSFLYEGKFYLQVMSDQTNTMINIDMKDGLYCPIVLKSYLYKKHACYLAMMPMSLSRVIFHIYHRISYQV